MRDKQVAVKNLPEEIADFYDAIVEKVADLRLNARESMAQVKKEQEVLAFQLRQKLAKSEALRKADFRQIMGEVIEKREARQQEVMEKLAQFQREEQAVASGLQKFFRDSREARRRDFKRFMAEAARATKARKKEVEEIASASMAIRKSAEVTIARFREEREEAAKNWKALAEKMQKIRSSKTHAEANNADSEPKMHAAFPSMVDPEALPSKKAKAKKQVEASE